MENKGKVKFIRKNGKVIPIKAGKDDKAGSYVKGKKSVNYAKKEARAYNRAKSENKRIAKKHNTRGMITGGLALGASLLLGRKKPRSAMDHVFAGVMGLTAGAAITGKTWKKYRNNEERMNKATTSISALKGSSV